MKNFIIYFLFSGIFFFFFPLFSGAFATSLQLDPAEVSSPAGAIFKVKVNVNAGSEKIKSADAYIIYDPAILEPQAVGDGTFFAVVNNDISTSGTVYVSGMVDDPTVPVTGTGTIATISFKGLIEGTNTLEFDCTEGSTNGSMIIDADANETNSIVCSENGTSAVTIGSGSTVEPTTSNAEPTPSVLPKSGVFENVVKFAVPGMILFFIGTGIRLIL